MSSESEFGWKRALNSAATAVVLAGGLAFTPATALAQSQSEAEAEDATAVGEIVVTATRREENLQSVPIAVTAFSGEALAETRIQTFADLAQATPGPTFVPISGASGSQMQMRGQYASDDSPAFDTPVGIFIDDIYYGSVASFYPDFYDIEQLAVLRGPQGTTFGRNTTGGALQITSRRPSFDGYEGTVSATIRSQDGFESTGAFNMPLSENMAARFAYSVKNVGGDMYNVTTGNHLNDANIWSGRASLLWRPASELDILTSVSYTRDDSLGDGAVLIGQGALIASLNNSFDSGNTYQDDDGRAERDIINAFVRADYRMDWATFTSITGYRTLDAFYREDIDGSPLPIAPNKIDINEEQQFSQEFRLTSPSGGQLEWVAGLYYLNQSVYRSETYTFGGLAPWRINTLSGGLAVRARISGDIETTSIAPFGEATWHFNDQWAITGGVRYTYDTKENVTDQVNINNPGASTVFFGLPKTVAAEDSWDAWTPRVILEFQPTEDLFFYASAARGFKSGGYNYAAPTVAQAQTAILPETNTSYEIGAKTTWFDGRFRANLALYNAVTQDLQVRSLVGTVLQVNNAGEAEVQGLELELVAAPTDALTLGFNYAYTDAVYNEYAGCATYTNTAPPPATLSWDCAGNRIPFVPENSFNAFAEFEWLLANDATLTARVEDSWADAYEVHIGNGDLNPTLAAQGIAAPGFGPIIPRGMTEKDHTINAFLTYEAPGGDWSVQAWARNVTDERYVTFATNYFFYLLTNAEATAAAPNTLTEANRASVSRGRTFGVTATFNFN